jgi:hypothetical protein
MGGVLLFHVLCHICWRHFVLSLSHQLLALLVAISLLLALG